MRGNGNKHNTVSDGACPLAWSERIQFLPVYVEHLIVDSWF